MTEEVANIETDNPNKKKGRKKRKNFLSNAKKYGKKDQFGRGTKMTEELYQYFVGILDAMKKGIEEEDERQALVNNVLERTKGEELNIAGNQLGCRVIELLLPLSSAEDLERYMEVLAPELRRLCADNFTSHVVETLLRVSCERATEHLQETEVKEEPEQEPPKKKKKKDKKSKSKYTEEHIKNCYDFTLKVCKYALNNLEDFVWDTYANHILRSALKCLSGITLLPGEKPKVNMFIITKTPNKGIAPHEKLQYKIVPQEFKDLVVEFANRLSSWPQFNDLPYKNVTSALLQVLLFAVKNTDKALTKNIVQKLLNESFAPDNWNNAEGNDDKKEEKVDLDAEGEDGASVPLQKTELPPVFSCEPSVRCLEAAIFVAKKKTYTQIYAKCFINRLAQLAAMPLLNYTVQRLFDNCQVKEELEPMFEELSDRYPALLASGNSGVLVAMAKACHRLQTKQAHFLNNLEAALCCSSPEHQKYFPVLLLRLLPLPRVRVDQLDTEYFIHVHGSVILQTVLDFQRPAKAVTGLLELTPDQLMVIFCDAKGCHVADAFFKGRFVGVKARDKMVWKLKGYYQKLALSQYGSRAFEQVFASCTVEQRVKIMTEMADKSNLLNASMYGRLLADKLQLKLFQSNEENWKAAVCKDCREAKDTGKKKHK
ncbi:nucleolar protein 9 [Plutella xylostella]|uniref:nucleolar protein 9 n=1 Tax=Plutella xylostella TaxID=51655 RepID=UPI00203312E4|nr:nucleolar protein 9 [Plutella xylostella]